jgi:hypothetical protein
LRSGVSWPGTRPRPGLGAPSLSAMLRLAWRLFGPPGRARERCGPEAVRLACLGQRRSSPSAHLPDRVLDGGVDVFVVDHPARGLPQGLLGWHVGAEAVGGASFAQAVPPDFAVHVVIVLHKRAACDDRRSRMARRRWLRNSRRPVRSGPVRSAGRASQFTVFARIGGRRAAASRSAVARALQGPPAEVDPARRCWPSRAGSSRDGRPA